MAPLARSLSYIPVHNSTRTEDRAVWLAQVGVLTRQHRLKRAERYDLAAQRRKEEGDETGQRWHASRADGQRRRIESVSGCGSGDAVLRIDCKGCGSRRYLLRSCGSTLLCSHCRGRRNAKVRNRFRAARLVALGIARRAGVMVGFSRWSEKLLTLTVPHSEAGKTLSPERRVELLVGAWDSLRRTLRRALDGAHRGAARAHWYAAHEWTEGADGSGHPHLHIWLLCPFIDRGWLVGAWRAAIARVGHSWGNGEVPIVDLRMARGRDGRTGDGCANELIKYMTKDLKDGTRGHVAPAMYARAYVLYDGRRRLQGSRGFIALADDACKCPDCGEAHGFDSSTIREGSSGHAFAETLARGAIAERQKRKRLAA